MAELQHLIDQLRDGDPALRADAADALRERGDGAAEPSLVRALEDPDPEVRTAAAHALGRVGGREAVPALVRATRDEDGEVWDNALLSLVEIGEPAVGYVIELTRSEDESSRALGFEVLGELTKVDDPRPVTALSAGFSDPSPRVRASAVNAVPGAKYSPRDAEFGQLTPRLVSLLAGDPEATVRVSAARTLGFRGGVEAVTALRAALHDADPTVRETARGSLSRLGVVGDT